MKKTSAEAESLLRELVAVVRESGDIIRRQWREERQVRHKGRVDLVTQTDLAVESFLKERLAALTPGVGFLAEESSEAGARPAGDCWIIDPVDGTTNFVHRIPQVGTSVALWRDGHVALGVVNVPMMDECFWAARGLGAFCNGKAVAVSRETELQQCLCATGFPYDVDRKLPEVLERLRLMLPATQGMRRIGAASVDLAYVACGRLDVFYELWLKPWDMAAGWLLVEEAGGRLTLPSEAGYVFGGEVVATNGRVHAAVCGLLRRAAERAAEEQSRRS